MALVQGGVRIILITGDGDGAGYRATRTGHGYNILPGGFLSGGLRQWLREWPGEQGVGRR